MLNIQIFGTKKCKETQKAERFFAERGIKFHFIDLKDKPFSKGELENITKNHNILDMIDENSKVYIDGGYKYRIFNAFDEILENPLLTKTPVVRNKMLSTFGFSPDIWKVWIAESKKN